MEVVDSESRIWLWIFFPISWATQFGHGMVGTIVGPTQPYLAKNTGVAIDTINFVWTFGFFGFLVGSIVIGFTFQQHIKSARGKLIFLAATISTAGILTVALPLTSSFPILATIRVAQFFCTGAFMTAESPLIVSLLGPEKSAPFILLEHAVIACGCFASTFLVRPFLPEEESIDKDAICNSKLANITIEEEVVIIDEISTSLVPQTLPDIAWPFIITGSWCVVFSLGFLVLAFLPYPMPTYHTHLDTTKKEDMKSEKSKHQTSSSNGTLLFFTVTFFYFATACAIERIYQPMATTFGLCGPLDLLPSQAAATDSFYNGGFMVGRLVSIIAVSFLKPRTIIMISLVNCVLAAILLCVVAGTSMYGLYLGTAWIGFALSWQFGATYSWVATKVDITGDLSSFPFIACGFGSLVTPPLVGFIFTSSLGPMSIIYLTLIFCLLECLLFLAMIMVTKSLFPSPQPIPAI